MDINENINKDRLYFWLFTVNLIDLIGTCLAFALCAFSLHICLQRQIHIFHINLVVLIVNFHIHGFILLGGGIFKCVVALIDFSVLAKPSVYPTNILLLLTETLRAWSAIAAIFATTISGNYAIWSSSLFKKIFVGFWIKRKECRPNFINYTVVERAYATFYLGKLLSIISV